MISISSDLPNSFRAGDSVTFSVSARDHLPADGWSADAFFWRDGKAVKAPSTTTNGDKFALTLAASESTKMKPGICNWFVRFSKGATVESSANFQVQIQANLADATPSAARKILANIDAVLAGRLMPYGDIESSNLNGQEINRIVVNDLIMLQKFYESKVRNEDAAAGIGSRGRAQSIIR